MPTLAVNKRARFDYTILDTFTAGIVLAGHEVKAARSGNMSLKGSFVTIKGSEVFLTNAHIGLYPKAGPLPSYDPTRSRKLLMKKKEIATLIGKRKIEGLTLVPLSLYTVRNRIKVNVGLARGKKKYEKRETIKKRDVAREVRQHMMR